MLIIFEHDEVTYEWQYDAVGHLFVAPAPAELSDAVDACIKCVRHDKKYPPCTKINELACKAAIHFDLFSDQDKYYVERYFKEQQAAKEQYSGALRAAWILLLKPPKEVYQKDLEDILIENKTDLATVHSFLRRILQLRRDGAGRTIRRRLYLDRAIASIALAPELKDRDLDEIEALVKCIAEKLTRSVPISENVPG